jgi:hypothetical protein
MRQRRRSPNPCCYKSTNTDAKCGTKVQILTQKALLACVSASARQNLATLLQVYTYV